MVDLPLPQTKFKSLALSQDFVTEVSSTKVLTKVPAKRPGKHDWFRVHPDPAYRLEAIGLLKYAEDDDDLYAVDPDLFAEIADLADPYTLFTAMNRQKVVSLIPVRLAGADGREHGAWKSLRAAMSIAMDKWTNVKWSRSLGAYEIATVNPNVVIPEPAWPEKSFDELIEIAFEGRIIRGLDHLVIRKMHGDA